MKYLELTDNEGNVRDRRPIELGTLTDDAGVLCMVYEKPYPDKPGHTIVIGKRIDTDQVVCAAYNHTLPRQREYCIGQIWKDTLNNPKFQSVQPKPSKGK